MLISIENVSLGFGAEDILKDISLTVEKGQRIALIGPNGAGKTTLLNMMAKIRECDLGKINYSPDLRIGYLKQNGGLSAKGTIESEMKDALSKVYQLERDMIATGEKMAIILDHTSKGYKELEKTYHSIETEFISLDGYKADVLINTILTGMGFSAFARDTAVSTMSGGERTRLMLCKLLLEQPQLLILDEATNHLDFAMLSWLENYLANYKGAILTVSHDRWFLDRVTNITWEIEGLAIIPYTAGYSGYKLLKEQRLERIEKEYEKYCAEVAKLTDYAQKNMARASTSQSAKSRLRMIEHLDVAPPPPKSTKAPKICFTAKIRPVSDILITEELRVSVGDSGSEKVLLETFDFHVKRGEKIAIIGENGTGKSTLLKTLAGKLPSSKGDIAWGRNVQFSFFEQDSGDLNSNKSVLDELWDRYPKSSERELRTLIGGMGLIGDEAFKKVGSLSGGERARLKLAMLSMETANTLLLDEPTNHLDVDAKEALEEALLSYEGTLIIVSHDRWLLSKVPTRIIRLEDGQYESFSDGFEAMQEVISLRKQEQSNASITARAIPMPEKTYRNKAQRSADAMAKKRLQEIEIEIANLEVLQEECNEKLTDTNISADYQKLSEATEELIAIDSKLAQLYDEWDNTLS